MITTWIKALLNIVPHVTDLITNTRLIKCLRIFLPYKKSSHVLFQTNFFKFLSSKLLDRITTVAFRLFGYCTKTFFHFTYKKYQFNFGIYLPCVNGSNLSLHISIHISQGMIQHDVGKTKN